MKAQSMQSKHAQRLIRCLAILTGVAILLPGNPLVVARYTHSPVDEPTVKIPAEQLDALVAPIALYPDNLMSQTLV
ncbi:MAG TPA: DUF3300 domain-containing protein, partial [Pyrinomonadaceae bacterium]|nr:DUF3300 domain-containing protein [Pyrinomonadaceae bacterium]